MKINKAIEIIFIAISIIVLTNISYFAQSGTYAQGGIAFTVGLPKGEFKNNINDTGFGITGKIGVGFEDMPFMIGAELTYMNYGDEKRTVPFSLTIPDVKVDVTTTNNIVLGNLFLKLQMPSGMIRPYLDGFFGFNYLFTETSVENQNNTNIFEDDKVATSTNFDDFAMSYGGGGGMLIQLYRNDDEESEDVGQTIFLDLNAKYLRGGRAKYLTQGAIERRNGKIKITPSESKTDILTFNIGVVISF